MFGTFLTRSFTLRSALAAVAVVSAAPAPAVAACYAWPIESVYDGDTIRVEIPELPTELRSVGVRLANIDTPEINGECERESAAAIEARDALAAMLASGEPVEVCPIRWEKYGRILATVWVGTLDVGEEMVRRGLQRPYEGGKRGGWCP